MPSRVRLWVYDTDVPEWDYVTLNMAAVAVHDTTPTWEETDRLGRTVQITPPDASEAASWANTVDLVFHRNRCFTENVKPPGGTDRLFYEWLRHFVRDLDSQLYFYIDTYGTDPSGTAVHTITYYKGRLRRPLPPWLIDAQFNLDRGGEYLKLTLVVDQDQGEGTVPDFEDDPQQSPPLVPRTVS